MSQFKAAKPGQYIHCAFITFPTVQDGEVVAFFAVDNYSRFAFAPLSTKHFNIHAAHEHLMQVLNELLKKQPEAKPTFVLSYGKDFWDELIQQFTNTATLIYNIDEANRIAVPVIEEMLEALGKTKQDS